MPTPRISPAEHVSGPCAAARKSRLRSNNRPRRQRLVPLLDQLETRQLLSAGTTAGAAATLSSLTVQLTQTSAAAIADLTKLAHASGATLDATSIPGLYQLAAPQKSLTALQATLSSSPLVQYATPTQTVEQTMVPNDPYYAAAQSGLNGKWGINAPTAWNTTTGSTGITVADVDTGINYNHPDLANNVWLNQAEIPATVRPILTDTNHDNLITFADLNNTINIGPGKIVDTNGDGVITGADVIAPATAGGWSSGSTQDGAAAYPDDLIGWNFVANTNDPMDDNSHGTVTAGIIGAVGNNATGLSGVDWNVQIMAVKALDSTGAGSDIDAAEAIDYAVDHGARVINASWGLTGSDPTIAAAIQYADSHGVIIVAAAGNNGTSDTQTTYSPASYSAQFPNVISVAATDSTGALASWSNFGVGTVQLAAPGVNIISTLFGSYGFMSGTSMAAPFVTGTIALVETAHPTWSMSQVIDAVLDHTTPDPALSGKVTTGGILNAAAAVANTDGAYVTSATTSASPLTSIQVNFNEEINPATISPQQVTITGPRGPISGVSIAPVAGSNDHAFLISFPPQTAAGNYSLTVGPAIQDLYGNKMDQNRNGTNGQTTDAFTKTFTVASPVTAQQLAAMTPASQSATGRTTATAESLATAPRSGTATNEGAPDRVAISVLDFLDQNGTTPRKPKPAPAGA